jgi:adenylate cyclase
VLPFTKMSGNAEQQHFCEDITEDIITELSRFRQMHVVSRHSSSRFRGTDIDMIRAGRELGVHYLVEGSVRRMGARTHIQESRVTMKPVAMVDYRLRAGEALIASRQPSFA